MPQHDDQIVRPLTETDQMLLDVKYRVRQLAASRVHAPNVEQAYRDWLAWCTNYVRAQIQRIPALEMRHAPLC